MSPVVSQPTPYIDLKSDLGALNFERSGGSNEPIFQRLSNKVAENDDQWGGKFRAVRGDENSMIRPQRSEQ